MTEEVQTGSADMTDQVNESILKDLDLRCETNNVLHHTSEISVKELFVRRGQPFTLTLTLSQPFQPELYPLSVTAATGCHYSEERGTVSYFGIPDIVTRSPSAKAVWKIELQEKKSSPKKGVLVLSITPPANAPIGEYIVSAQYRDEEMLLAMPVVLFNPWCPDNKAAVLVVLSAQIEVVKDAIEEIEQALSEVQDPFNDVLDDDQEGDEPRGNQDTYWSDKDRRVIGPCQGLIKASAACLRKLTSAIKANGDVTTSQNLSQLDDLADITKEISPGVDDLALCLYPPMDYSGVESNVTKLAALLKKVLEIIRSSHVCGESELNWVQFLDGAVDHNLQKAKDLIQQDS